MSELVDDFFITLRKGDSLNLSPFSVFFVHMVSLRDPQKSSQVVLSCRTKENRDISLLSLKTGLCEFQETEFVFMDSDAAVLSCVGNCDVDIHGIAALAFDSDEESEESSGDEMEQDVRAAIKNELIRKSEGIVKEEKKEVIVKEPVKREREIDDSKPHEPVKREREIDDSKVIKEEIPQKKRKIIKKVLKGGIEIFDQEVGNGAMAKRGKTVQVHYEGMLYNGRIFDSNKKDKESPFRFRLGVGEVIRGWDRGLEGMRVGGKRKIVVPPKLAYGERGRPPVIPPNSRLIFTVELVKVESKQ